MYGRSRPLLALVVLGVLGCQATAEQVHPQRYEVTATVLENAKDGPQLCYAVQDSNPPQCTGPALIGWDWSKVHHESLSGTRWGTYTVTGTWDGAALTMTDPVRPPDEGPGYPRTLTEFTTPCERPPGGWGLVDQAKAGQTAAYAAVHRAEKATDFAVAWIDLLRPDERRSDMPVGMRYVLNLAFRGDLAGRERWIRQVYGGALCISRVKYSERQLVQIQNEISSRPEVLLASAEPTQQFVDVLAFVATESLQTELDQKYGVGLTAVRGWLQPVR